jgi:hypothetical protein
MSGPLIIPAITAAGQAAQVTAFDAAVGQLAIGGVEMGDTGWRDVSSLLRTGLAKMTGSSPGVARMRRLGNVIHFNFHLNVTAGSITSLFTASLPSGWGANLDGAASTFLNSATPSYTSTSNNVNTPTTANHTFVSATAMGFSIALPNPGTVTWQGSYSAVAAWPTAVIGTALP